MIGGLLRPGKNMIAGVKMGRNQQDRDHFGRLHLAKQAQNQDFPLAPPDVLADNGNMPNRAPHQTEAVWRLTVESWLVCQD
jgi:hypothetical protein